MLKLGINSLFSLFGAIFTDSTLVTLFSVFVRRLKCYDGSEIFFGRGREESYFPTSPDLILTVIQSLYH